MSPKKIKATRQLVFLIVVSCVMFSVDLLALDSSVSIEMERSTRKEVKIALTQFVLGEGAVDSEEFGVKARKVLENDLRLSEMFVQIKPEIFEKLEQ